VDGALESVGLAQRADAAVATYSRGMKQLLHLARSLIADASVLIFDEPTIGMDPVGAASFRAIVQALRAGGKAILLATHDMDEATQLCARVSLIDKGRILALSSPAQLVASTALSSSLVFECADRQAAEALRAADGVKGFAELDAAAHRYRCSVESDRLIPALYSRLLALGATGLTVVQPSLEDVYLEMFRDGRNA
jgi:ABC-2 type transport system ATP-binding protein